MNAEIISVGTELLLGQIVDTNSAYLSEHLAKIGIGVFYKTTVGDNVDRLREALHIAYSRADVIITTGGLGPTVDDLTIETIADYWNEKMVTDQTSLDKIKEFCRKRGWVMRENNAKQADRPESASIIVNPLGTAPGMILEKEGKITISMPGVPMEMYRMFQETVVPYLRQRSGCTTEIILSRNLKFVGIGESMAEEKVRDLMEGQTNPTIAPYAKSIEVHLRVTAKANTPKEAEDMVDGETAKIMERIGEFYYGSDEERLEDIVGKMLIENNIKIALAESCAGGLISHRLTNVPGISAVYERGFVTYSNEAKADLLGVSRDTLAEFGAVSEETALEMASGARKAAKSDVAISVTGIAGPDGGTAEKPVGLVYMAVSGAKGDEVQKHIFYGDREMVKARTAQNALMMLKKYLEK